LICSMNISGSAESDKTQFACNLLQKIGIDKKTADRKILKLSGGEQQRVGIARALFHSPDIIIANEPTGNLDSETENDILNILTQTSQTSKSVTIHTPTAAVHTIKK